MYFIHRIFIFKDRQVQQRTSLATSIVVALGRNYLWADLGMPQTCGVSGIGAKLERKREAAPASKLKTSAPLLARSRSAR